MEGFASGTHISEGGPRSRHFLRARAGFRASAGVFGIVPAWERGAEAHQLWEQGGHCPAVSECWSVPGRGLCPLIPWLPSMRLSNRDMHGLPPQLQIRLSGVTLESAGFF